MNRLHATSFDVAAAAGVSQSTVSRALAGKASVNEATRMRVIETAHRLRYCVDENAVRLRTGKTGTLAVVMICRAGADSKDINPFHYSLLGAVCAAASARGHETLVSFQGVQNDLQGFYEEHRKADGLIVIGTTVNAAAWQYFRDINKSGANMVCWGSPFDELEWIRSNNHQGARTATGHLIEQGYSEIICIASRRSPQRQFDERYEGYVERMRESGLQPHLIEFDEDLPRDEQGRRSVATLIDSGRSFDAIFAACDEIALGALQELRRRNMVVPDQIGLVGFDGVRAGAHATPPLTSIEPDFHAAGAMLVDRLLNLISGKTTDQRRVPVRLVERASSKKPARNAAK